jgi:protein-tyrosine phosphatase
MFTRILMVCVGNVCRSPMAEAVFASRLAGRGVRAVVESAGIAPVVGRPADPIARELMRERGLDISRHRSRQLSPWIARSFDIILVMESDQVRAVERIFPGARGRVHRIGRWGDFDVPDPYQRDRVVFEQALGLILRGLDDFESAFLGPTAPPR